jgi:hypothetical protein
MIKKLTPAQKNSLKSFRDKWLKIGLCTDPVDLDLAKKSMVKVYKCAGLVCPEKFLFFDSPVAAFKKMSKLPTSDFCLGSMSAPWLSQYDVFISFGLELPQIEGLLSAAQTCGWFIPFDDLVVLIDRPCAIHMVDGELHNESGPAVSYRDGFHVWSIQGRRVNEQIVMNPQTQSIDDINSEQNEEIKRIRIERFGWANYLRDVNAKEIDRRTNDIEFTEESLYHAGDMKILVCVCPSTGKVFSLEVDPATLTCSEAQKYLSSGLSERIISAS